MNTDYLQLSLCLFFYLVILKLYQEILSLNINENYVTWLCASNAIWYGNFQCSSVEDNMNDRWEKRITIMWLLNLVSTPLVIFLYHLKRNTVCFQSIPPTPLKHLSFIISQHVGGGGGEYSEHNHPFRLWIIK